MTADPFLGQMTLAELTVEDGTRPDKPDLGKTDLRTRQSGRRLAAIHRHYLGGLSRIAKVLRRIEAGDAPPADLAHIVLDTQMSKNLRAVGTICGQECGVLKMHHDIEEQAVFPELHSRGTPQIRVIVDRLRAEHEVVHELIERLAASAHDLSNEPTDEGFRVTTEIFDRLVSVVQSHFKYEETTLEDALGVFGVDI